jgi:hypothetical protein
MSSTSVYTKVGSDLTSPYVFLPEISYRANYSVTGGTNEALTFALTIYEGQTLRFSNSVSESAPTTSAFDTFALYAVGGGPSLGIDNLSITLTAAPTNSGSGVSGSDIGGPIVIPEPSTYAACAGAAVLGLAFWRRRRAAAKALAA